MEDSVNIGESFSVIIFKNYNKKLMESHQIQSNSTVATTV
jgi:hypothetical protein